MIFRVCKICIAIRHNSDTVASSQACSLMIYRRIVGCRLLVGGQLLIVVQSQSIIIINHVKI